MGWDKSNSFRESKLHNILLGEGDIRAGTTQSVVVYNRENETHLRMLAYCFHQLTCPDL